MGEATIVFGQILNIKVIHIQVENNEGRLIIRLVDHSYTQQLAEKVLLVLMDQVNGSMPTSDLLDMFQKTYGESLTLDDLLTTLCDHVQVILHLFPSF